MYDKNSQAIFQEGDNNITKIKPRKTAAAIVLRMAQKTSLRRRNTELSTAVLYDYNDYRTN